MVVVDPVDDEVQAGANRMVGLPVEDEAVQPVLEQGPDAEAAGDQERQLPRHVAAGGAEPHSGDDDRDEDERRDRGVDAAEEVEEATLEQAWRGLEPLGALRCHPMRNLSAAGAGRSGRVRAA